MLNRSITIALLSGAAWLAQASAHAGELTLFARDGFSGRQMSFTGPVYNLSRNGFNDQASSVVVRSGRWQVCEHADFQGQCVVLDRGEYADLRGLNGRVSSLREIDERDERQRGRRDERYGDSAYPSDGRRDGRRRDRGYQDDGDGGPAVELYRKAEFRDDRRDLNEAALRDFQAIGFNDRVQSIVIRYGQWEFCEHADFRGVCQVFGPGRYAHLGQMSSKFSSMRRVR